uniref:uncharacterized protein wu:fi75a02 n=1 Tax=Epinephelus lanceolatus TaxID=310571 RepID=UPI001444D438|nr:uncharacterized protein wu:fi75a02 [Epinephelus lanceolatus]
MRTDQKLSSLSRFQLVQNTAAMLLTALNGLAPSYISDLLTPYSTPRSLRSADLGLLAVPRSRLKLRAFSAPPPVSPLSPPPCASSSPSAPSIAPPPPCASSPSSAPSLIPLPPVALLRPPPSSVPPASLFPCAPSSCPPLPPVSFDPCTPPNSSSFSPLPSSSPPLPPSLLPSPPAPRSVPSTPFISPPLVASFFLRPPCSYPSPLSSSSSSTTPVSSLPPPPPSHLSCLSSSSPPVPLFLHPSPPHSVSVSPSPPCSSAPPLPLLYHHSTPLVSPPLPPPPPPDFFTPYTSAICSPLSPSSSPVSLSPSPPLSSVPVAPSLPPPPPPPSPCCPCSSLLPRLLSAHRLEVRRLLRGALASLGRRLDSLERRSRRKRRNKWSRQRGEEDGAGLGAVSFSSAPSHSPTHPPHVTTSSSSSSSDSEDSHTYSSVSLSEQRRRSRGEDEDVEGGGRKRRRKNHKENREEEDEEKDAGRFVGRMAVSFRGGRGAEEEALLTLHKFNHKKHRREEGGSSQSEKAVSIVRQNGYRVPLLLLPHSVSGSSSQQALHLLQSAQRGQTCSQSEAFDISSGQWRFSDITAPLSFFSNPHAFHLWHLGFSSTSTFSPIPILRLSAVAVETMSESVRGGACVSPLRPLKDWTAPPSLSSDHCYVRSPIPSPTFSARRQQKQRANHRSFRLRLPRLQPLPLRSANGLSAPLAIGQSAVSSEFLSVNGESCKRVSQIRIRRASPRETLLTPMGLPKVKRLKKKEFSLEEIYTNKNYKSPTTKRSLETIFEEPREKDGALLLIGQQRRRRLLLFPDFTQPRKRKRPQGAGLPVAMVPRKRAAARRHCHGAGDDESDLDVMLVERLSALEDFLTRQGLDV